MDHFTAMWQHVAAFFADCPNLFGFDLLNEPFPGSPGGTVFWTIINKMCEVLGKKMGKTVQVLDLAGALGDPAQLTKLLEVAEDKALFREVVMSGAELIRQFDTQVYAPFFQKVAAAIREVTPRGIMLMENCYYSNLGIPCATPRLTDAEGREEPLFAFTPHGYDLTVDTDAYQTASNNRVDVIFEEHMRTQERLDCPVLVGEWGAGDGKLEEIPHLAHLLDLFDRNLWSQTYWLMQRRSSTARLWICFRAPIRKRSQAASGLFAMIGRSACSHWSMSRIEHIPLRLSSTCRAHSKAWRRMAAIT